MDMEQNKTVVLLLVPDVSQSELWDLKELEGRTDKGEKVLFRYDAARACLYWAGWRGGLARIFVSLDDKRQGEEYLVIGADQIKGSAEPGEEGKMAPSYLLTILVPQFLFGIPVSVL